MSGPVRTIDAATLARWQGDSAGRTLYVFDVRTPEEYVAGHIPGAWCGIRSRLAEIVPKLRPSDSVVLTSADGILAKLAAALRKTASVPAFALDGGTAAWREAGYPLERGAARMATAADDIRARAREQTENVEDAMLRSIVGSKQGLPCSLAVEKREHRIHE